MDAPQPTHGSPRFVCPHCHALAQQDWPLSVKVLPDHDGEFESWDEVDRSTCFACRRHTIWRARYARHGKRWEILYPRLAMGEPPNGSMPDHLRDLYEEARQVAPVSPRAASALLRLVAENIIKDAASADSRTNLYRAIGDLASQGVLNRLNQQVADYVRLTGNDAVHVIGELQDDDTEDQARTLFRFVNLLAKQLIEEPQEVQALYESLPEEKRAAIAKRDRAQQ